MRLTVIHNPTAGSANMSRSELEAILRDTGYHVRYQTTNGTWKKVLQEPADLIVAAGGDGTVRKVATELAGTSASPRPFAVVPLGTANNFARALGIRDDLASRARQWRRARPILLDLGTIIIGRRARLFVEGAGGGLMAQAIARGRGEIEERSAGPRDETRQALAMLARLAIGIEPARWEIELDGQDASGDYIAVEALNIGLVGPNLTLAPDAEATDGELDLVTVDRDSRSAILRQLDARLDGRTPPPDGFTVRRFRRARLLPPQGAPFHVDDQTPWQEGNRSVTIEIVVRPAAVPMLR
jgi:diacylglycerol kinase (ATP)